MVNNFQSKLIDWFRAEQRDLPWRKAYDPYAVWVSEIMLQQTQVKTVLPYFDRWMARFPNLQTLAEADEDSVLKHWEGLGYYSRARNLWKAAKQVADGPIPDSVEELKKLPGIGDYTAGAIASIAFQKDDPLVDGNVIRVLSRLNDFHGNVSENRDYFWKTAKESLPAGQARDFNQGLMELGALICTPKNPKCEVCPIKEDCLAYQRGTVNEVPNLGKRAAKERITVAIAVIKKDGKIYIQKRPDGGLMAGLWEFPGGKVEEGEAIEAALEREIQEELAIRIKEVKPIMVIKHSYTRFAVELHCFSAEYESGKLALGAAVEGKWVRLNELSSYAFPAANVKLIERLLLTD